MKFKPFDKVLVRDCDTEQWLPKLYFRFQDGMHQVTTTSAWRECIPYKGNEHLCGTTDSPEEPLKKGDLVLVWDGGMSRKAIRVYSHNEDGKHIAYEDFTGTVGTFSWEHAERFVPAPVEEAPAT